MEVMTVALRHVPVLDDDMRCAHGSIGDVVKTRIAERERSGCVAALYFRALRTKVPSNITNRLERAGFRTFLWAASSRTYAMKSNFGRCERPRSFRFLTASPPSQALPDASGDR